MSWRSLLSTGVVGTSALSHRILQQQKQKWPYVRLSALSCRYTLKKKNNTFDSFSYLLLWYSGRSLLHSSVEMRSVEVWQYSIVILLLYSNYISLFYWLKQSLLRGDDDHWNCCHELYIILQVRYASPGGSLSLHMFVQRVLTVLEEWTAASKSLYSVRLATCVHLGLIEKYPAHREPTRIYLDRCRKWG